MDNKEIMLEALRGVEDPELHQDIVSLGMVKDLQVSPEKAVSLTIALTQEGCPLKHEIGNNAKQALLNAGATNVTIQFGKLSEEEKKKIFANRQVPEQKPIQKGSIKHILAVGSGKGGVGKSTVVTNLAIALHQKGWKVGVLDADVLGPNIPTMFQIQKKAFSQGEHIVPIVNHGVKVMSIGFLLPDDNTPVIWRGPMISSSIEQLFEMTLWEELDILLIDLPPGTSDTMLTVAQALPIDGGLVVTTPAKVSETDATKFLKTFEKLNVPLYGIIENMSYFIAPDTQKRYDLFGTGGGQRISQLSNIPLIGQIPFEMETGACGNGEEPVVVSCPASSSAQAFSKIAELLMSQLTQSK